MLVDLNRDLIINANKYKYYANLIIKYDSSNTLDEVLADTENKIISISFKVEGNKIGCIDISLQKQLNSNTRKWENTNTAILNNVYIDNLCNITEDLQSDQGTRYIIYSCLNIIKLFTWVKYINSRIEVEDCILKEKIVEYH